MNDEKYRKSCERATPGCIIFLIDQSFSMTDGIAGSPRPKCEAVATAINRLIGDLIISCERGEDKPRHYFDIAMIGYTTDPNNVGIIGSVLQGELEARDLVSIVDLYDHPLDVELRQKDDGAGGLVEIKFPVWYRVPPPEKMAGTPMCGALQCCHQVAAKWCLEHAQSFPPVVIHLTDGESTDGNPEPVAEALRSLATDDGNLLLFNCHLSSSNAQPILFPTAEPGLPDDFSRLLFRMSSPLPDKLRRQAEVKSIMAAAGARAMVFNADSTAMIKLLSVGTPVQEAAREAPHVALETEPEPAPALR